MICCPENRFLSFTAKNVKNHRRVSENWRAAWRNSGTPWEDSGTRQPMSGVVMKVDAMEIDEQIGRAHV